jgi:hypothetical protein
MNGLVLDRFLGLDAGEFEEVKHPRSAGGEFAKKGTGSAGKKITHVSQLKPSEMKMLKSWRFPSSTFFSLGGIKPSVATQQLHKSDKFAALLDKLPAFEGKVYRGTTAEPGEEKNFKVGSTYRLNRHVSTSQGTGTARSFLPVQVSQKYGPGMLFEINQHSGAQISHLGNKESFTGKEREVVLKRGTHYRVTGVRNQPIKRYGQVQNTPVISLEELAQEMQHKDTGRVLDGFLDQSNLSEDQSSILEWLGNNAIGPTKSDDCIGALDAFVTGHDGVFGRRRMMGGRQRE